MHARCESCTPAEGVDEGEATDDGVKQRVWVRGSDLRPIGASPVVGFGGQPIGEGIVFVIVGLGYAVITLVLVAQAWATLRRARASVGWPTVDGVVLGSAVVHDLVGSHRYARRVYVPSIQYAYEVSGERLVSDVLAVSRIDHRDYAPIEALMRPFAKGARVAVHVDPIDPRRATLLTGAQEHHWRLLAVRVGHVALGIGMVVVGFAFG